MDYKDTLNLPKTSFPMRADLVKREPARLEKWQAMDIYGQIRKEREGSPRFVLHDGPPFANGDVHIGTALNKTLKDMIVKYKSLVGFDAPYVPGWDCHGLPIEFKVSQEMRKEGKTDASAADTRTRCEAYARRFIDLQREQFKRLGVFGEWDNPYLTLNKSYEADELRLFADVVEAGLVYRGKKPVYWSIPCRTALAEAEVEYQDHVSQSVYVKFPVVGIPHLYVLIWTTTPWTLPANLAVAFNPKLNYAQIQVGEESYLVSVGLLDELVEKCEWGDHHIIRSLDAGQLEQIEFHHPFCERTGNLYPADFVEDSTGTGFVHIAPGHGLEDYGLGMAHGLPVFSPVDDEGRLTTTSDLPLEAQIDADLVGRSVLEKKGMSEANAAVIERLKANQRLLHHEPYTHSYPHCWRSKTPVVFRAMDQWFIGMDHEGFRDRALNEINSVSWIPDWGKNRIVGAVGSRPDWCISRQRTWGVPIPAFYGANGEAILEPEVIRNTAALVEEEGSNIWFELDCEALWQKVRPQNWAGVEASGKSTDTLDVWIDSGSSSRSVTMNRETLRGTVGGPRKDFQADLYLEGSDQHRGWFQSSLLLSLAGNGAAPYHSVLTHGFMVDADREKISKSKQGQGGYVKPQTCEAYIKDYGADIVRLWVASQDFRNDIVVSSDRIKKVGETYRGIRNALRFQLSNLFDFDPVAGLVEKDDLTLIDRWILSRLDEVTRQVIEAYEQYEFHTVYQVLGQFAVVDLSAVFHDVVKDRLYTLSASHPKRRSTQTALFHLVKQLSQLLSPILAFTADEVWEFIPGHDPACSVHQSTLTQPDFRASGEERTRWDVIFSLRDRVLLKLEEKRREKVIGKALEAVVVVRTGVVAELALADVRDDLREMLNVSHLQLVRGDGPVDVELNGHRQSTASEEGVFVFAASEFGMAKCGRCWHWEGDLGASSNHPALCGRCAEAVDIDLSPPTA